MNGKKFISAATGVDAGVGHNMEPCTSEIGIIKMTFPSYNIVFVESPGFDDTKGSDSDILKMISDNVCRSVPNMQLIGRPRRILASLLTAQKLTESASMS